MKTSKPWYTSRTLWANIVAVLIVLIVQLQAVPTIPQAWVPYLAVGIAVGNMILRLITTQPLALTAEQPGPDGIAYRPVPLPEQIPAQTPTPPPVAPSPYMGVPGQATEGVSFDTAPTPPADLPTLPGKEGPHDGC